MTNKGLLNDEALDQVVGGNKGYVYFRENDGAYDAFVCNRPLSKDELTDLLNGIAPPDRNLDGQLLLGVEKGDKAQQVLDVWKKHYGELSYIPM